MESSDQISLHDLIEKSRNLTRQIARLEELRARRNELDALVLEARAKSQANRSGRFGPRKAIIMLLSTSPRDRAELVRLAVERVQTRSKNPKRVLYTTVGQLLNEGRIRDEGGTLSLNEALQTA